MDLVTGASGFLGQYLVKELNKLDKNLMLPSHSEFDLTQEGNVKRLFFSTTEIDTVYHLAALVGGIGANQAHPAQFFYDNMRIGMNVIHYSMLSKVKKIVFVGTTCSYPKFASIPFREWGLFDGYPEDTNAPYGIAKRSLLTMLQAYRDEYGLKFAYVIPTNLYGPGDNFDDNTSHVIPALIKKCLSGKDEIEIWGSGKATRDFLFVEDAAKAIVKIGANYDSFEPLNVGSGNEISISALLYEICQATGYTGKIKWDISKPDGQPRRRLDIHNVYNAVGWKPETNLQDGLRRTVEWYKQQLKTVI